MTGINCYDLHGNWFRMSQLQLAALHQWISVATVVLIRVLDNVFSHREPKPAAPAADAE